MYVALKCYIDSRQDKVPDILFATIEIPEEMPINGTGSLIQAR